MDAVEQDLAKIERHPSEDAYAYLENGAFHIQPEVQGNVLKGRLAVTVFTGLLSGAQVPMDAPLRLSVELTDYDCYIPRLSPRRTAASTTLPSSRRPPRT